VNESPHLSTQPGQLHEQRIAAGITRLSSVIPTIGLDMLGDPTLYTVVRRLVRIDADPVGASGGRPVSHDDP
jgi:hypothetical protein